MKKHSKIIIILFVLAILFEMAMMGYNAVIYKMYEAKHVINNTPHTIEEATIKKEKNGTLISLQVNQKIEEVYNVTLHLKEGNKDAYVMGDIGDKRYILKRDNVDATKFKVYLSEATDVESITISFDESQIGMEGIQSIEINGNLEYMPSRDFQFSRMCIIFGIAVAIYFVFVLIAKFKHKEYKFDKLKVFLILLFILGVGVGSFVVPLTTYDEHTHFWRAYEISQGNIISTSKNALPKSVVDLVVDEKGTYHLYDRTYTDLKENLKKSLHPQDVEDFFVGGASAYSPFNYLPQLIGIVAGRLIHANPMVIIYLGRMANFLCFMVLAYLSIKLMPKEKWKNILMVVCLLPMTLNLVTSLSPDSLAIGLAMFLMSYILHIKYSDKKITIFQMCVLAVISVWMSLVKIAYLPLLLLFLLIPTKKFKSKKIYYAIFVGIMLLTIAINLVWMKISSTEGMAAIRTNSEEQMLYVLSNPINFITAMGSTILENSYEYISTMLGGFCTSPLSIIILTILILLTTFTKTNKAEKTDIVLKRKDRIVITLALLAVVFLIFAGLYIQWTIATFPQVEGIQGRYFLPILALLLVLLESNTIELKMKNRNIVYVIIMILIYVSVFASIIQSYS